MWALVCVVARTCEGVDIPLECRLLHPPVAGPQERHAPVFVLGVRMVHLEEVVQHVGHRGLDGHVTLGALFVFEWCRGLWSVPDREDSVVAVVVFDVESTESA